MPPRDNGPPEKLRPYIALGLDLQWLNGSKDAEGECIFCGSENRFYVKIETGQYRCVKCEEHGNIYIFIRALWSLSYRSTQGYEELQKEKGLLYPSTLAEWEVVKSTVNGEWLVPAYNAKGEIVQLYRWAKILKKETWKYILKPIPTLGQGMHGVNLYEPDKQVVYVCEGFFDGATWYETLARCQETETDIIPTGNRLRSMLSDANVLALPGCNVSLEPWRSLFADKVVVLMYDNDYPRHNTKTKATIPPAGFNAVKRAVTCLTKGPNPPHELFYLRWGENGYTKDLKDGTDIKDYLNAAT